jgi:ProP effector
MTDHASESVPASEPVPAAAAEPESAATPAASDATPPASDSKKKPKGPPGRPAQQQRAAHQVLERLCQLYPKMFGARFLPLKLGVYQELLALHPDDFKKEDLKVALGLHARSTRYLESVAAGEKRHDLNGDPVEDVAPEHVHHAIMEVFRRRQARSRQDLRPWLRDRLVAAIEASGLSREAFAERVPTQDPVALAALDEAFAQIGEQAAKREALRRAFQASGSTVEAFADMYGMDPDVVRRAVEQPA